MRLGLDPNISRNILDVNRPTIGKYTTSYLVEYRPTIVFDLHRTLKGSINQSINRGNTGSQAQCGQQYKRYNIPNLKLFQYIFQYDFCRIVSYQYRGVLNHIADDTYCQYKPYWTKFDLKWLRLLNSRRRHPHPHLPPCSHCPHRRP